MRSPLAHVANLHRSVARNLALHGQVPLIRYSGLNICPSQHCGVKERIARRGRGSGKRAFRVEEGRAAYHVLSRRLGWRERRILRRAQVCAGSLLERGDREAAADHGVPTPHFWAPGEAEARLEVGETIGSGVQSRGSSVGADNTCGNGGISDKLQRPCIDVHVHLVIVQLGPRSAILVPKAQVQSQTVSYAPIVLRKSGDEPVACVPSSGTDASADALRETEGPISGWISFGSIARIVSPGTEAKDYGSQLARIAGIEDIKIVFLQLKAGLEHMPPMSVDQRFVELSHSRGEVLGNDGIAEIVESSRYNRTTRPARETKCRQSIDSRWIPIRDS